MKVLLTAALLISVSTAAFAQLSGFPMGTLAEPGGKASGSFGVYAGASEDYDAVGARVTLYTAEDALRFFVGAASYELDDFDNVGGVHAGLTWILPVFTGEGANLAVRASGYVLEEATRGPVSVDTSGAVLMALYSLPVGSFRLNAGLGADIMQSEVTTGSGLARSKVDEDETDPIFAVGASTLLGGYITVFAEVYVVEEASVGIGFQGYF